MRIIMMSALALAIAGSLSGCADALYFYETDKISLTLEVRPDSSQPVQGNLGLKQRIVLVSPKKNEKTSSSANAHSTSECNNSIENASGQNVNDCGEALSALSSFRFKKEEGALWDFGPVTIQHAFVTGEAASQFDSSALNKKGVEAAEAIASPNNINKAGVQLSVISNIVDLLKEQPEDAAAQQHLSQLNHLAEHTMPAQYPFTFYKSVTASSFSHLELIKDTTKIDTYEKNIDGLLKYWGAVAAVETTINSALAQPDSYRLNGASIDEPLIKTGLQGTGQAAEKEKQRISKALSSTPIYINFMNALK